jgi:hypothetical protein
MRFAIAQPILPRTVERSRQIHAWEGTARKSAPSPLLLKPQCQTRLRALPIA